MQRHHLALHKSDKFTTPEGRIINFWGRYIERDQWQRQSIYVFFDTRTDECLELKLAQVRRLRRLN